MEKICAGIVFLMMCLTGYSQTTYYVRTTGNNAFTALQAQNPATPWQTVSKATTTVTTSNSIINIGAGTFTENGRLNVSPGVSIEGVDSNQTILKLHYNAPGMGTNDGAMSLSSAAGTNGNQFIRNMHITGDSLAYGGVNIRGRDNVIVTGVKLTNFYHYLIAFNGIGPDLATGCEFGNSSTYKSYEAIFTAYTGGLYVHDNILNQTGMAVGLNYDILVSITGHNAGLRFLRNMCYKPLNDGPASINRNFCIESWREQGGHEIAYNTFSGGGNHIDAGTEGSVKGIYPYSWWIHDNTFLMADQFPTTPGVFSCGVQFEDAVSDAIVEYNHFKNLAIGFMISQTHNATDITDRVRVNNNIFENIGLKDGGYGSWAIFLDNIEAGTIIRNINIYNNTFVLNKSRTALYLFARDGVIQNVQFTNNIVTGALSGYMLFEGASGSSNISSQNNILFNNSFTNNPQVVGTPAPVNFTQSGSQKVNPQFVSTTDFHLQAGSPAITSGLNPPNTYSGRWPAPTTNISPVADAGGNKNITLPTNSVTQVGLGTDADGTIVSYNWLQLTGPIGPIVTSPNTATTNIVSMPAGSYTFQLRVTDNLGATGVDTASIVVNPAPPANVPPIASAGGNKVIQLPVSTVTQSGSGTDSDGSVVSYSWSKTSGPATYNIVSPTSATTVINGLTTAGTYGFTLTVTDNLGATGTATATITVNPANNIAPTANAGVNQSITWPVNSTTLTGSGTDTDGSIVAYSWSKISGGAATITSPSSASTTLTGLAVGVYQFQLIVVDNSGATASDVMQVTVGKGSATISLSNLTQVYTGAALFPTVTTNPAGLSYGLTLGGVPGGKVDVGSYPAIAGITDPNWNFTPASATFTITKATAVISATSATYNYDALSHTIVGTISPNVAGLTYAYSSGTAPVNIGTHTETISLVNANYQATPVVVTITIVSNPAIIFISDTVFVHDGFSHGVTVTSQWPYTLTNSPHTQAGVYPVTATINDGIHTGSASANLTILKRAAVLSWAQPQAIPYGSLLTTSILNATADISGTWTYSYPLGTVLPIGVTSVTATFVPTDSVNKTGGSISRSITVFGVNPFLDYFISGNGKFFFIEQ